MTDFTKYEDIASLIAKEVLQEIKPEELIRLRAWIEACPENSRLYAHIVNPENFKNRNAALTKINTQREWGKHLYRRNKSRKINLFKRTLTIAASIIIPLLIVGGIVNHQRTFRQHQPQIAQIQEIKPESGKAVLILDDGRTIVLDSVDHLSFVEKDGTLVRKSGGKIDYISNIDNQSQQPVFNTIKVPRGGEYHLVLADGTQVYLNSMSSLKYPVRFTGPAREVEFSGEAFFEVNKDVRRPFIVKTALMRIEVLGTSFNLNAYENSEKIITTLIEGSVKINPGAVNQTSILSPEEQAIFYVKDAKTEIKKVDVNLYTAWKDGNFVFYDSRLEDIMTTLTRWYATDVIYRDNLVKDLRFSGKLNRKSNINEILEIIKSSRKVQVEIINNTIAFSELM